MLRARLPYFLTSHDAVLDLQEQAKKCATLLVMANDSIGVQQNGVSVATGEFIVNKVFWLRKSRLRCSVSN